MEELFEEVAAGEGVYEVVDCFAFYGTLVGEDVVAFFYPFGFYVGAFFI